MVFTPSTPAVFSFSTPLSKVASSCLTVLNGIGWVSVNSFSTSVATGGIGLFSSPPTSGTFSDDLPANSKTLL